MFPPYNNPYSPRDPFTHLSSNMPPELVSQLMYGGGGMGGASYGPGAPIHVDIPRSPEIAKMIETLRKGASTKEGTTPVSERAPSLHGEFENLVFLNLNGLRAQTTFKVTGLARQLKSAAFTKICVLVESSAASEGDKSKIEGELARSVRKNLLAPPLKALWNIADYINARRKGMGINPHHLQSADAISQLVSTLKVPYSFSVLSETNSPRLEEHRNRSVLCNQRLPELLASSVGSVTPELLLSAARAALMADTELLKAREKVLAEEIRKHLAGSGKDTLFVVLQAPAHRTIRRQVKEGSLSLFNPHSQKVQKHLPAGFGSLDIPSAWDQKILKSLSGVTLSSADIARALLGRLLTLDSQGDPLESETLAKILRKHHRSQRGDAAAIYSSAIAASMKDDDATEILWNACNRFHILSQSPFLGQSDLGFSLLRHLRMYIDNNAKLFGEKKK